MHEVLYRILNVFALPFWNLKFSFQLQLLFLSYEGEVASQKEYQLSSWMFYWTELIGKNISFTLFCYLSGIRSTTLKASTVISHYICIPVTLISLFHSTIEIKSFLLLFSYFFQIFMSEWLKRKYNSILMLHHKLLKVQL